MAKSTAAKLDQLAELLEDLQAERREHAEALAEIDEVLRRYGIDPEDVGAEEPAGGPSRKKKTRGKKKKKTAARKKTTGKKTGARKKRGAAKKKATSRKKKKSAGGGGRKKGAGTRKKTGSGRKKSGGKKRQSAAGESGEESVMAFLEDQGESGATTAEINEHWRDEGRGGRADTALARLVKSGRIVRRDHEGRGSLYRVS